MKKLIGLVVPFCIVTMSCKPQLHGEEGESESDAQGYTSRNCQQQAAQKAAAKYTGLVVSAFDQEISKGSVAANFKTLENVQRLVCMANGESTFGTDVGGTFHGAFQAAGDTFPAFCPGYNVKSEAGNTACALRILFKPMANEIKIPRWSKWPSTSTKCKNGSALRKCFDDNVDKNFKRI